MQLSRRSEDIKPVIAVLIAGILWGIINIFIKNLSAHGLDAFQISAIRMTVSVIVMFLFLLITDRSKFRISIKDIWIFACTGIISVVLFNTCYFYTMINSQASVAVVLLYTSPIFVMLISAVVFKEKNLLLAKSSRKPAREFQFLS